MSHSNWNEEIEEENFNNTLSQRTEELYRVPNTETDAEGFIEVIVLPMRDMVIFPRMVSPIFISNENALRAIQEAQTHNHTLIALTQIGQRLCAWSLRFFYRVWRVR